MNSTSIERHVAVLAFPFASHPGVVFGILCRLANAAPNVKFSFFSTANSNASLFSVPTPRNIKAYDVPDGYSEGDMSEERSPEEAIGSFLKVAPENFRRGMQAAEREAGRSVNCIVADAFFWFVREMAEEKGVSWVPVWVPGACSISVHVYTDLIRKTVGLEGNNGVVGRDDELLKFIPGFSELRLGNLPSGILSGNLQSEISVLLHKMGQNVPQATALCINSLEELEPTIITDLKSKFKEVFNIGPVNLTSPPQSAKISDVHGCIPWLDKQNARSVVYICFGHVVSPTPDELIAIAETLEARKIPFLWSLREILAAHLPVGFLERTSKYGKIVPWAPQSKVLGHSSVGVSINHCGWNSVMECIAAGVPIIGRPFLGDNHINSWMVEKVWRIGVRIKSGVFTKVETAQAIELVLFSEQGQKLRDQIGRLKELVLNAVGPNGSSTQNFKTLLGVINGDK